MGGAKKGAANPGGINSGNPLEKTTCTITANELVSLYVDSRLTLLQIAELTGHGHASIARYLKILKVPLRKRYGWDREINPNGVNTGNVLAKTSAPVNVDQLRKLYCEEKMTLREIALQFDVCHITVGYWFKIAGIQTRSRNEISKASYERYHAKY